MLRYKSSKPCTSCGRPLREHIERVSLGRDMKGKYACIVRMEGLGMRGKR